MAKKIHIRAHIKLKFRNKFYAKSATKKKLRRAVTLKQKNHGLKEIEQNYKPDNSINLYTGCFDLTVPSVLDLNKNYAATVKFITDLRIVVKNSRQRINLYFDHVNEIGPAALLYLTAEIFRIRRQYPKRLTGTYPTNDHILKLLEGMGFYKLIDVKSILNDEVVTEDEDSYIMKFTSDIGNIGNQVHIFLKKLRVYTTLTDRDIGRMYGAMDEAMNNVTDHAFKKGTHHSLENGPYIPMIKRWWLGGFIDGKNKNIFLMMHDQGSGIPATLPLSSQFGFDTNTIKEIFNSLGIAKAKDSDYIKLATNTYESGTGLKYRGRGFMRMKQLVDQMGGGELRVLSLKGEYSYYVNEINVTEEAFDRDKPIAGTIVLWRLNYEKKGLSNDANNRYG